MLTVSYETPDQNNGDTVTTYKVEWDREPTFSSLLSLPDKGVAYLQATQNMSYTIRSLTKGLIYYVRVSAANKQGYSGYQIASPPFAAPTNQIPGKPSSITVSQVTGQNTWLQVQWSAPEIPNHGLWCGGGGSGVGFTEHERCPVGMGSGQDADGGTAITKYVLEWDTVPSFNGIEGFPHKSRVDITNLATRPFTYNIQSLTCALTGARCDGAVLVKAPGPTC
jgi:hypothetical protein